MNHDNIQGHWKQLNGQIKQHWGKLTDDDLKVSDGNAEYLSERLQKRYGIAPTMRQTRSRLLKNGCAITDGKRCAITDGKRLPLRLIACNVNVYNVSSGILM